jgi:hypothetical protein
VDKFILNNNNNNQKKEPLPRMKEEFPPKNLVSCPRNNQYVCGMGRRMWICGLMQVKANAGLTQFPALSSSGRKRY